MATKQLNEEQIGRLKEQAAKYGGVGDASFKAAVDKQYGAGSYDKITKNVAGSIQSGTIQGDKTAAENTLKQPAQSFAMNTQELAARNKTRDVAFKETTPNPNGLAVNNAPSPGKERNELGGVGGNNVNMGVSSAATSIPMKKPVVQSINPATGEMFDANGKSLGTGSIKDAEQAQNNVVNTIEQNIDAAAKAEEERKKQQEARILEDQKLKEQQMKEAEDAAVKREELIKKDSADKAAQEAEQMRLAEERKARDVEEMKRTQATEREAMNAANELEKWKNEQAIIEAKKNQDVAQQQAAMAFNKLGLGFGTGIINTVQQIATEGATAIAGLKLQANANEAESRRATSKLEFDFAKDINATIDKYTDIQMKIKDNAISRINSTTENLLLSEETKRKEKNAIIDKYKSEIRKTEDEMYVEFERNRDKALERARQLEQEMKQKETDAINKAKLSVASGDWARTTPDKRREAERSMGLPPGTLDTEMHSQINQLITNAVDSVLGKGYPLGNREYIVSQVVSEMKNGRNLESAALYVLERELRNNPDYIRAKEQAELSSNMKTASDVASFNQTYGTDVTYSFNIGDGTDFSTNQSLISSAPNEASFKNNNPTGMTWGISPELKDMLDSAGIEYTIGTARPKNEGGNYIKFATVKDGMDAYTIALTQRGDDIYERLKKWVGTSEGDSYATKLMQKAGIPKGTKFSQLSPEQLSALQYHQLQKESPAFLRALGPEAVKNMEGQKISVDGKNNGIAKNNEWYINNVPGWNSLDVKEKEDIKKMSDEGLATYIEKNTKTTGEDLTKEEKAILNAGNFISTVAAGEGNFWFSKDDAKTVGQNISSMIENGYTVDDITSFLSGFTNEEKAMYYKDGKVYFKNTGVDNGYTIQELIRLTQKK